MVDVDPGLRSSPHTVTAAKRATDAADVAIQYADSQAAEKVQRAHEVISAEYKEAMVRARAASDIATATKNTAYAVVTQEAVERSAATATKAAAALEVTAKAETEAEAKAKVQIEAKKVEEQERAQKKQDAMIEPLGQVVNRCLKFLVVSVFGLRLRRLREVTDPTASDQWQSLRSKITEEMRSRAILCLGMATIAGMFVIVLSGADKKIPYRVCEVSITSSLIGAHLCHCGFVSLGATAEQVRAMLNIAWICCSWLFSVCVGLILLEAGAFSCVVAAVATVWSGYGDDSKGLEIVILTMSVIYGILRLPHVVVRIL